jgi:hypothetical protein
VPNPGFEGTGGLPLPLSGGTVNVLSGGVPDQWRAFAVGGTIDMEVVPVEADELAAGSPATNAVLFRVSAFGADQGFDDDNGRFEIVAGIRYHAEFYIKSANEDASNQTFNFGFPYFDSGGTYIPGEPGGQPGLQATPEWQLVVAPSFEAPKGATNGHISWRCVGDGGEDAILIALPFVAPEEEIAFPTSLTCRRQEDTVTLTWLNHETYDSLKVLRDGAELATLAATDTLYVDSGVPEGAHTYQVLASFLGSDDGPACDVSVYVVPIGTKVSVDLNDVDVENGLAGSQTADGGDGETTFVICGPEADLREARSNWGTEDPTPDFPDGQFYFNVLDVPMKAQDAFRLEATVYDDPARAQAGLYLQYTNWESTGPGDIANTFYPNANPPARFLTGTGTWVVLSWDISGAGFRSFQQGSSDFRLGVTDTGRLCVDKVELTYFPGPTNLTCRRTGEGVALAWENNGDYDSVKVLRGGEELAVLAGDASSFSDTDPQEGENTYQVLAVVGTLEMGGSCSITVFLLENGTKVSVDLGEVDGEQGLVNSQRDDGGDGENEWVICGPAADIQEARSNWGQADPTFEAPDPFFYFNVTDEALKSQGKLRIEATVYDDPARAGVGLGLQYTNQDSTGPGDIPDTFFPQESLPTVLLEGTDAWVVLAWDIDDAGFRTFQQGSSDFRLGVTDGGRLCVDKVEVIYTGGGGPVKPVFLRGDPNNDGTANITDGIYILNFLFLGGPKPTCQESADPNDDGTVNITDGIYVLNYLFLGGPEPLAPGPAGKGLPCGPDRTESPKDLGCESYTKC